MNIIEKTIPFLKSLHHGASGFVGTPPHRMSISGTSSQRPRLWISRHWGGSGDRSLVVMVE